SVSRSQGDRIQNPRGLGLASTRASAKAKPLGGSRLNPKGVGWESVGTSWSTGGDEVTSGTDCTVVSGTRVTPSKTSSSVLASSGAKVTTYKHTEGWDSPLRERPPKRSR